MLKAFETRSAELISAATTTAIQIATVMAGFMVVTVADHLWAGAFGLHDEIFNQSVQWEFWLHGDPWRANLALWPTYAASLVGVAVLIWLAGRAVRGVSSKRY